ncbi:stage VI sporulation protein D [Heyndrickxia vini]|uniref:Stage VI sporulation protein D n=1 Tax=Heyndrickxia vini TaxID=1476025 RepID=A0ABX7E5X9_9BACI|nr:stage VI sporulation protein D [Heyndrickxia vini]QQZ10693.1 stage VI sporulation protein D [Heyndrickxia vini]
MSQSQSSLRFSLEESIWFKKGQEVDELLSISLDPEITIQEQEQYIQIIGNLQLSGEYKGKEEVEQEQELDLHGKFAHHVEYRTTDEVFYFEHQFPVDVTIPKSRIDQIADIDVNIDSFDYLLPEKGNLKLNADLSILGIRNEETFTEEEKQEIPISVSQRNSLQEETSEESFDNVDEEESLELSAELNEWHLENDEEQESDDQVPRFLTTTNESTEQESSVQEEFFQPFTVEARKIQPEEEIPINIENKNDEPTINLHSYDEEDIKDELLQFSRQETESSEDIEVESPADVDEEQEEQEVEETENKKKKKFGKYESISLADFFARKTDEKAAKLKVCIVQQGETLDVLAEKYDISVQQILRMNHLEINQDVYEGQVLYIPSYATTLKSKIE